MTRNQPYECKTPFQVEVQFYLNELYKTDEMISQHFQELKIHEVVKRRIQLYKDNFGQDPRIELVVGREIDLF